MTNQRYQNDMRQLGGILFVLGVCALVFPVKDAVLGISAYGPNGTGTDDGIDLLQLFSLIGDLSVFLLGLIAMCLGYLLLVRDYGAPCLTLMAIVWEQTTFIEWVTGMVNFSKASEPNFGTKDGNYFFTTGLLTMFFLCFLLYGSLGLILFAIYDYQIKDPPTRNATYYRGRLVFYSFLYLGVGVFRFLMPGVRVYSNLGGGPLEAPFPHVAGPIVFPEMEMALGCSCCVLALWGMARGFGIMAEGSLFGNLVGFNYLAYVALKVLCQIGIYAPPPAVASAAAITVVFLPAHIMLSFLDDKARMSPEQIDPDYYKVNDSPDDQLSSPKISHTQDEEQPREQYAGASSDDDEESGKY